MSVATVRDLSIAAAGAPLVHGVSFAIQKGEILALVGESGSGKTLTALALMGLLPTALRGQGEIAFEGGVAGAEIRALRGNRVSMIFQEPMTSLNPLHTVKRQIAEAVRVHHPRLPAAEVERRVQAALEQVGLRTVAERPRAYPHELSGGERQRAMIAMAIVNGPALLIADEPTTSLDVTVQAQILELLQRLRRELGMAVLLITHDLAIVKRLADRVAIMQEGRIVETASAVELFRAPQEEYTRRLLAAERGEPPPALEKTETLLASERLGVTVPVGSKWWGARSRRPLLQDVDLRVGSGETLGIVGESGSGKTTLALALMRLIPSEGAILFENRRLDALAGTALRAERRHLQIVFQDPFSSLNPRMTIGRIVREGLDVHEPQLAAKERDARVDAILGEVGLSPAMRDRYPHEFSGGQRQRISLARALILRPRLLILDEPTSALDGSVQAQILDLLKGLQRKYGLSYLFISHDLRTVRAVSHRILVLKDGRVVEEGSAEAIFRAPREPYTRALLQAALA